MPDRELIVVTGYVEIPGHPRSREEYDRFGEQLCSLSEAPVRVLRRPLEDCWLDEHVRGKRVEHATADNPAKNTLADHTVQHQKTAWLLEALETEPSAEVLVWIDYGIFHQPGITVKVIDEFLRRVRGCSTLAIPGCWPHARRMFHSPDWRFCGSSLVAPRAHVHPFHEAVRDVTLERLSTTNRVTWEVNDWAEVDHRRLVPIQWYPANHDQTQFTNYADS